MPRFHLSKRWCQARAAAAAVIIISGVCCVAPVRAAVMQISPVRIEFLPGQRAQTLQVVNRGKEAMAAQVRVMRWRQAEGRNVLEPATDVVASPAIMKVGPGRRQTVRLVRLETSAPAQQMTYRVLLNELPSEEAQRWSGLRVLQGHSVPMFVDALLPQQERARPAGKGGVTDLTGVQAQLGGNGAGSATLRVSNGGKRALRISNVFTQSASGQLRSVDGGLLGYVLPGQHMSWPVKLAYPLSPGLTLKARFNDDSEAQAVPLEGAGR